MEQYAIEQRRILNAAIRVLAQQARVPQAARKRVEADLRRMWPSRIIEQVQAAGFIYDGQAWVRV